MHVVRGWAPPALLGLVLAFLGIGTAEVAGVAPARHVTTPVPTAGIDREQSLTPARIEVDERRIGQATAPPVATASAQPLATTRPLRTPAPTPTPTPTTRPTPTATAEPSPSPDPTPTPLPSPSPAPTPIASATPTPTPTPIASPAPPARPASPAPVRPADVLDLRPWKLTLPTGREGHPQEIRQPLLGALANGTYVGLTPDGGVRFRAPVGGVTTENSDYPRTELREMTPDGRREAAWSSRSGRHVMTLNQAITATPRAKPHVVAGQIHDAEDDVVMIRLEGHRLFVESEGDDAGLLDPAYRLGTRFTVSVVATSSGIRVVYNQKRIVHVRKVGRGWYFKAGCYPQSNPDRGDRPSAYGEVVIYALTVQHAPA
jgi:hypothetical protein